MCCNGEGNFQENTKGLFWRIIWYVCGVTFILVACSVYYWEWDMHRVQLSLSVYTFATFGDGLVCFLMLTNNPVSWMVGSCTIVFQCLLALLFGTKENDLTTNGVIGYTLGHVLQLLMSVQIMMIQRDWGWVIFPYQCCTPYFICMASVWS